MRGLTTAASIWITAAIGVLAGVGLYVPMMFGGADAAVLSVFRWIENARAHAGLLLLRREVRARRQPLRRSHARTAGQLGFSVANFSYRLEGVGVDERSLRHKMTLQTTDRKAAARLARWLEENQTVLEFRLSPTGD